MLVEGPQDSSGTRVTSKGNSTRSKFSLRFYNHDFSVVIINTALSSPCWSRLNIRYAEKVEVKAVLTVRASSSSPQASVQAQMPHRGGLEAFPPNFSSVQETQLRAQRGRGSHRRHEPAWGLHPITPEDVIV